MATGSKKSKWGIVVLVLCVLSVIGIIAQNPDPEPHTEPTFIEINTLPDDPVVRILNTRYTALMDKYVGYVDNNGLSLELGHEIFAIELDGGITLCVTKFGHKDDVIYEMQTTFCCNVKGFSEEQVDAYEKSMKEAMYELYGGLDFAEVTYNRTPEYFYTNIRIINMDNSSNIEKLVKSGAIEMDYNNGELISLEKTVKGYLYDGYIPKYKEA